MNNYGNKTKGGCITAIIFLGLVSLLLVGFGIINLIVHADYYFGSARDISEMTADGGSPQKGEYVQVGVDVCFDWYAETTHKVNGIPTGKEQHCIIMLENGDIMSLTVKGKKNYAKIDEVIDSTWDYLYDSTGTKYLHTPVIFEGKIESVGTEVKKYYDDYMSDLLDACEASWGYRPNYYELTIDTTNNKISTLLWYLAGALLVAFFVYAVVSSAKSLKAIIIAEKAGSNVKAYMQNRQNNMNNGNQDNVYGNDIVGYSNMPDNNYVNDIVNRSDNNDNNSGI